MSRLETSRLVLDLHRPDDLAPLAAMWADPEVLRHLGPPSGAEESWMRLLRYRGLWAVLGFGYWAVREKESGRYVGDVGFADFRRGLKPSIDGLAEAGWVLARWAHGRGYGSEALAAALGWLDARPVPIRAVCLIDPGNEASLRIAEKGGFGEAVTVSFRARRMLLLTREATLPACRSG